jgi:hypothetical protein
MSNGSRNVEFDQWEGRLPTTRLLRYVHAAVQRSSYFNYTTGKEVPGYDPAKDPNSGVGGGLGGRSVIGYREFPPREFFMPVGHCWWALLLGYLGGLFAAFVYSRRMKELASSR